MKTNDDSYYNHPVFDSLKFRIETRQIIKLNNVITQWLWTGATGGYIQGISRVGKSSAFEVIRNTLKTRSKAPVPTHILSIPRRDKSSISTIFKNCCFSANLVVKRHQTADDLKNNFAHYLVDIALSYNVRQFVLLVDEMQRLKAFQFDAFAELYDVMRSLGVSLVVIFIGNTYESDPLIEEIKNPRFDHIRGRFFSQKSTFTGLESAEDVKFCLEQYDTLKYPSPDGPTYTQFFLPQAYEIGWRFADQYKVLWSVFRKYQKVLKLPSWGMQYFSCTANILLSDYLSQSVEAFCSEEMIEKCIDLSGLHTSQIDLSVP
jgi:hypothetical protein